LAATARSRTLEFEGEINNPEAIARTEYSLSTAIEKGVPCEMMTENQVANWDTAKAQEMMTAQIASLGVENIEVVFCNNDDMAIGVIAALNEVGYNLGDGGDEIIVIGVDCTDTAVEYINAGKLYGTVKQDVRRNGQGQHPHGHQRRSGQGLARRHRLHHG